MAADFDVISSPPGISIVVPAYNEAARRIDEPQRRHSMGRVFNALVRRLLLPRIQDSQCPRCATRCVKSAPLSALCARCLVTGSGVR